MYRDSDVRMSESVPLIFTKKAAAIRLPLYLCLKSGSALTGVRTMHAGYGKTCSVLFGPSAVADTRQSVFWVLRIGKCRLNIIQTAFGLSRSDGFNLKRHIDFLPLDAFIFQCVGNQGVAFQPLPVNTQDEAAAFRIRAQLHIFRERQVLA